MGICLVFGDFEVFSCSLIFENYFNMEIIVKIPSNIDINAFIYIQCYIFLRFVLLDGRRRIARVWYQLCGGIAISREYHVFATTLAHMAGRQAVLQVSLLKRVMSLAGSKHFCSNETPTHKDPVVGRFAVEGNIGLFISVVMNYFY